MFVDATVMTAMMTDEAQARSFAMRMQASSVRMTSPMIVAKAVSAVSTTLGLPLGEIAEAARVFLQLMNIQVLAVPPRAAYLALEAEALYGQGRHQANLTPDECMVYACARYYRQPLLFRHGGYALTDIATA